MPIRFRGHVGPIASMFFMLCLVFSFTASTAVAADLYIAQVPLLSESDSDVKRAKSQAMALMITRLTGQKASLKSKSIKSALADASSYVSRISRTTSSDTEQVFVQVGFDQQSVQALLRRSGLPIWSSDRANILSWLVLEEQGIQEIVADGSIEISDLLLAEAEYRGLPLVLPLMDLTDQLIIAPSDIWGDFVEPIEAASVRYQPNGLLTGKIFNNSDNVWQGQGKIKFSNEVVEWKFAGQSVNDLAALIVENLGRELSLRFALSNTSDEQLESQLHIVGVKDLNAYAKLQEVLAQVANITATELHSMQGEQMLITVNHQGSRDNLLINLGLQQRLELLDGQAVTPYSSSNSILAYYRWQ